MSISYTSFLLELQDRLTSSISSERMTAVFYIEFNDMSYLRELIQCLDEKQLINNIQTKIDTILQKESLCTSNNSQYQFIITHPISSLKDAEIFAKHIMHTFSEPFCIDGYMFYLFTSIGISISPLETLEAKALIHSSKKRMRQRREEGKNLYGFSHSIHAPVTLKYYNSIIRDLPEALEREEIYFLYQPQYSYSKQCFTGAEILCRWEHPKLGMIPPSVFIPIAEQSGMIAPLTVRSIVSAAKAFAFLKEHGIYNFSLSVNISPTFLMAGDFDETILFLLSQYELDKECLHFEITEEVLMQHSKHLKQTLLKLKSYNIQIELDDFGTGYTSLQHLAYLPIDTLKIDRSYIKGIYNSQRKKALFKAIVDIAYTLDINVIAEGVEKREEAEYIHTFENLTIQGYLYAKPLPLCALTTFIDAPS